MKDITITSNELPNFIKLANQFKQKFTQSLVNGIITITASELFLTKIGY